MSDAIWTWTVFTKYYLIMINGHGNDTHLYDDIKIDFSSNICPHIDHSFVLNHLNRCGQQLIAHYPEPEAKTLEYELAEEHAIDPRCVIVTNGATEAIYLVAQAFRLRPVIPQPTFSEYADACKMYPATHLDRTVLWLCNPNNPTGLVYSQQFVKKMLGQYDLMVLDQSYEDYTDQKIMTPAEAVSKPHLIQIHSMTKAYGVPGLRLGYITAHPLLADKLRRWLRPWSVSSFAIEAGLYLTVGIMKCRPDLKEAQRLRAELQKIVGITVMETQTSFMLCSIEGHSAFELKKYLAKVHHLLIRDASNFRGLTEHHFRIASQLPEENDMLVAAIRQFFVDAPEEIALPF